MKIAIDLTQIPVEKTGVGIYAKFLVKELCRLNQVDGNFHFIFFLQDDDHEFVELIREQDPRLNSSFTIKSRRFRKLPYRFFFEQFLLPRYCKKEKVDVIYSFHYTMPYFTNILRVVTVPDMTFYLLPELHTKIKRLYFGTLIPKSLRKSHRVVTISESTKNDLLARFPDVNKDKIKVIYLGVELPETTLGQEEERRRLKGYGIVPGRYVLYVGTLEPRKNIPNIIRAFHSVQHADEAYSEYKLVIAGKKGWFYDEIFETAKKLHMEENVVFTGYVSEEQKHILLRHAYMFVYPSFYEGFGIPVIEAMGWGIPVITGNVSSLPEVAGDAALQVTPHHWQEIATAMLKLLKNKDLHKKLSEQGRKRARAFRWESTAERTLAVFETILHDYNIPPWRKDS